MGLTPLGNVSEPLFSPGKWGVEAPLGGEWSQNGKVTREPAAWELQLETVRYGPRPLLLPVPAPPAGTWGSNDVNWLSSPASAGSMLITTQP